MNDDGPQPRIAQEGDVLGEGLLQCRVGHRVAAVLHDDERVLVALEPRQRLDEGARLECRRSDRTQVTALTGQPVVVLGGAHVL